MEEKTFFENGDVKVTNSRFVTGGQTYAMSNVTSVKTFIQKPSRVFGVLLLIVGLIMLLNSLMFGFVLVALASVILYMQKSIYHVMLSTSGGETSALKTNEREYIEKVVNALNDAIVHRG
jgi:hypothetical protein